MILIFSTKLPHIHFTHSTIGEFELTNLKCNGPPRVGNGFRLELTLAPTLWCALRDQELKWGQPEDSVLKKHNNLWFFPFINFSLT